MTSVASRPTTAATQQPFAATAEEQQRDDLLLMQECYQLFDQIPSDEEDQSAEPLANSITLHKLSVALQQHTGTTYSHQQLTDMIRSVDLNLSGDIQFNEFLQMIQRSRKDESDARKRPGTAHHLRQPKKAAVSAAEKVWSTEMLHEIFDELDTDNDGYISINDLKSIFERDEQQLSEEEVYTIAYMVDPGNHGIISYAAFQKLMMSHE